MHEAKGIPRARPGEVWVEEPVILEMKEMEEDQADREVGKTELFTELLCPSFSVKSLMYWYH